MTGSGSQNPSTAADIAVIHILTGAVAGAFLTLAVGFLIAARSGGTPKTLTVAKVLAEIEYRAKSAEGKVRHPFFRRLREDI